MLSKVKQIHALTSIKRERVLPVTGHVLVRRLQKVSPTDVIVIASISPQYMLLDISQGLKVQPSRADELLQRKAGDELSKGDVIAGPVGLFQRVIRAPKAGIVRIAGEGKVLYEIGSSPFELHAGMDGTVTNIIPERGAIIESRGALIQGVWGNGKVTYGVLQPVSNDLLQELVPEQLNISFRGTILTAGYCNNPEVFELAGNIPIRGLILGSLSSELIPAAMAANFPIMVVDGFGSTPMNNAAENILVANKDKNVALNAHIYNQFMGNIPEAIISNPTQPETDIPIESETLKAGKKVIITNSTYAPQIGTVDRINPGKQTVSSGIETQTAEVSIGADQKTNIPLNNLEIINTK